ncbi:hypothetical protein NWP21_03800 [Anabaenopsis sp. FSS-46]|uniref:hypothetical protein n=1 Tax=Anabaenopsis sp. FSS-46 TaxID=2971766 RepID=UPI0024755A09|nr:hypothetical protein [Anabaenopsis sp. FSS-46]MDH6097982.1 hypothetical protein [Anabaenopsis sp. FSS-46]
MIDLVIGWVKDFFNPKIKEFTPVEKITPAKKGFHFEHDELKRLMKRLKGFETVEFTDAYGAPLTAETIEKRFCKKDGGIDCVINIIAPTEQGTKNVATRIRNILIKGDY